MLITYADHGLEHDGYVYRCAGWVPTRKSVVPQYENGAGRRTSRYSNGRTSTEGLVEIGKATIERWEHWICERGQAAHWLTTHGWIRKVIPGKFWRSGSPAYRFERSTLRS